MKAGPGNSVWLEHGKDDEKRPVLAQLRDLRVFDAGIEPGNDGVVFLEKCDGYFAATLTPAEVRQLAEELRGLAEEYEAQTR